jgi:hypothetical protein
MFLLIFLRKKLILIKLLAYRSYWTPIVTKTEIISAYEYYCYKEQYILICECQRRVVYLNEGRLNLVIDFLFVLTRSVKSAIRSNLRFCSEIIFFNSRYYKTIIGVEYGLFSICTYRFNKNRFIIHNNSNLVNVTINRIPFYLEHVIYFTSLSYKINLMLKWVIKKKKKNPINYYL